MQLLLINGVPVALLIILVIPSNYIPRLIELFIRLLYDGVSEAVRWAKSPLHHCLVGELCIPSRYIT